MKRKTLWLMLSWLIVAALVLASCGEAVPGEQEEEEEEEEVAPVGEQEEEEEEEEEEVEVVAVGEPQYGGTLTWYGYDHAISPADWDMHGILAPTPFYGPRVEGLLIGDVEKYGPRGTGEFTFAAPNVPEEYLTGALAESWTVTTEAITFKIRPGIMWEECSVMKSRELTADDIVHSMGLWLESQRIRSPSMVEWIDNIIAPDRYTVVFETNRFHCGWAAIIAVGRYVGIQPPEVDEAGASDWRNHIGVGTGPFLLEDHVRDVSITLVKNPNYRETTSIDGVKYSLPFVDTLMQPLIPDPATRIAALRTGQLDVMLGVFQMYADTLKKTSPDLLQTENLYSYALIINLRCDRPPFNDVEVRRAMMIGLELEPIMKAAHTVGLVYAYPSSPYDGPIYTPKDELPPETRLLFDYNPDLASDMLAKAGHPDGFPMDILFIPGWYGEGDAASMASAMWGDIGIDVSLLGKDNVSKAALTTYPPTYNDAVVGWSELGLGLAGLNRFLDPTNLMCYTPPDDIYEKYQAALQEPDSAKRSAVAKELLVYVLDQAIAIPIGVSKLLFSYWPWVKNYYGESVSGMSFDSQRVEALIWIDQALKAELGY